jgi:hypothetical protein
MSLAARPSYEELGVAVVRLTELLAERDALIARLEARQAELEARVAELEARLGQNSANSSRPPVLAEKFIRGGQAAGRYSLMTPPARRVCWTRTASWSVTFGGSGLSGAAADRLMCGRWPLWWSS